MAKTTSANKVQIGGTHYNKYKDFQPWDAIEHFNMGFLAGTAFKYLVRWRDKDGRRDLEKAKHYIDKLIETEEKKGTWRKTRTQQRQQQRRRKKNRRTIPAKHAQPWK